MKPVRFLPEAKRELLESAAFYDAQRPGLGGEFLRKAQAGINDAARNPRRWPELQYNVRRRLISRFPYGVLYRDYAEEVVIVAVMHFSRTPDYWIGRVEP